MMENPKAKRPDLDFLYEMASEQAGHFTTAQAELAGVSAALRSYYASTGAIRRVHPRVYRFKRYPSTQREEVVAAWLAVGKDSAVVSHESALDIWDLTDLIPDAIHLTVPRSRRHLPKLPGVRIHTTQRPLSSQDVSTNEAYVRVTSPGQSLLDAGHLGAEPSQIIFGIHQARSRGWIDDAQLRSDAEIYGQRVIELVDRAFAEARWRVAS
jgi:predicted transcriptional regulator of viral defense system